MPKISKSGQVGEYPYLFRWINKFGTVEIGKCSQTNSFIRLLDSGGMVWKGRCRYRSLDAALEDADAGAANWMKNELGVVDDD